MSVPCPESPGNEVTFTLFKDQEMIYNRTRSHEDNATNSRPPYSRVGIVLHVNTENESAHFWLTGVNASSLGVYRCEGIVTFPPPLLKKTSDLRVLVLVKGKYSSEVQRVFKSKHRGGGTSVISACTQSSTLNTS